MDALDLTSAESKSTYEEIKAYVLERHGLKVSNLYISQVKRKCGLAVGQNYNLSKKTSLDKGTQRKTTENELPSLTQCTA